MKVVEHTLPVKFEQILTLVYQCTAEEKKLLFRELMNDSLQLSIASEKSLAKDWLSKDEDEAWKDL